VIGVFLLTVFLNEVSKVHPSMPHVFSFGMSITYQGCNVDVNMSVAYEGCTVDFIHTVHLIGNRHTKKDNTCAIEGGTTSTSF
jgi:hypothetical protein